MGELYEKLYDEPVTLLTFVVSKDNNHNILDTSRSYIKILNIENKYRLFSYIKEIYLTYGDRRKKILTCKANHTYLDLIAHRILLQNNDGTVFNSRYYLDNFIPITEVYVGNKVMLTIIFSEPIRVSIGLYITPLSDDVCITTNNIYDRVSTKNYPHLHFHYYPPLNLTFMNVQKIHYVKKRSKYDQHESNRAKTYDEFGTRIYTRSHTRYMSDSIENKRFYYQLNMENNITIYDSVFIEYSIME